MKTLNRTLVAKDGVRLEISTAGHSGSTFLFVHGVGFCGECWRPIVQGLVAKGHRVVWMDARGHGSSGRASNPLSWWDIARDVVSVRGTLGGSVVGVGHSMGATAVLLAQLIDPECFTRIVAAEPVLVPPPTRRTIPLVSEEVLSRKGQFSSRDAARDELGAKPPFDRWNRLALDGYVERGFHDVEGGIELACDPAMEVEVWTGAAAHGAWQRLGEIRVPVRILVGSESSIVSEKWARATTERLPRGDLVTIEGSHLFPMENPRGSLEAILDVLG